VTVFFSAGEPSGDAYAAALARSLLDRAAAAGFDLQVAGIGGRRLREVATGPVEDSSRWGAIGIAEAIRVAPRVMRGYYAATRRLKELGQYSPYGESRLFVPIDFGYVNVRMARFARRAGWKVLYWIPPGSWRRHKQGADLPHVADEIVTPFEWSAELLRAQGAQAHWFGHPLKQLVADHLARSGHVERLPNRLAILPGSRVQEVYTNMRYAQDVIHHLVKLVPTHLTIEFAVAPSLEARRLRDAWASFGRRADTDLFTENDTYGCLRRARVAIVCSGTATLEAALCECPAIVVYRLAPIFALEARIRRPKFEYASLPNLLLRRAAVPELLGNAPTPEQAAQEVARLWLDGPQRSAQLTAFEEVARLLGPSDGIDRCADLAWEMLTGRRTSDPATPPTEPFDTQP
jgi:lipid-A-disaccharide synthase